jgi:hypothetical protein
MSKNRRAPGPVLLAPVPTVETGRCGCVGWLVEGELIAGFAEIDPNGLFASQEEADALAKDLCARWNAHSELLAALKACVEIVKTYGVGEYCLPKALDAIAKAEGSGGLGDG